MNFECVQQNATNSGWTPDLQSPYVIQVGNKRNQASQNFINNCSRGIANSSVSAISDRVNDNVVYGLISNESIFGGSGDGFYWSNNYNRVPFYGTSADTWISNNHITWLIGYNDNTAIFNEGMAGGFQGILYYNQKSNNLIHSAFNGFWNTLGCAIVNVCMSLNDPGVGIVHNFSAVQLQDNTSTDIAPYIQLNSNSVGVAFDGIQMEHIDGPLISVGSGDPLMPAGTQIRASFTGGQMFGTWGQAAVSPFGTINGAGTISISGLNINRGGISINQAAVAPGAAGTVVFNGNSAPNAQWLDVLSAASVSGCGTATATGTYRHITLNVTAGTPTACTINLSGTLTAAAVPNIQAHGSAVAWAGTGTTTTIVLGSAGMSGIYDIYGQ
jgi:hypothetical protein